MSLVVFNTRTRTKEPFVPAQAKVVRIYTCGLTVYAPMHIGHARTYSFWDFFRRYLEYRGHHVLSVINYTDVDDRIIERSGDRGCLDLAEEMVARFRSDCRALRIKDYAVYTRATDFIEEQVTMIAGLLEKGHAYIVDGEVFYDVTSFAEYGALSGRSLEEQEVGASGRVGEDVGRKRHPADFTLWKPPVDGQPCWQTGHAEWPAGRPGWHIECSAMATSLLGDHFDVHGGAIDNMFPHHENEIAQSEPLCGHPWVRYWLHPEHLDLHGEKMSKSLGNVIGVGDMVETHGCDLVRWFFASHHYRSKLPYSDELIAASAAGYARIRRLFDELAAKLAGQDLPAESSAPAYPTQAAEPAWPRARYKYLAGRYRPQTERFVDGFIAALDDDLNTPQAVACLFDYVSALYQDGIEEETDPVHLAPVYRALGRHLQVLGIEIADPALYPELVADYAQAPQGAATDGAGGDAVVDRLIAMRGEARQAKDFARADTIRDLLLAAGVVVEDKGDGAVRWHLKRG